MNAELMYRERTSRFLSQYRGAKVQVLKYGVGHGELQLRLWNPGSHEEVRLTCIDCQHICGPFSWENCQIEVEYDGEYLDSQKCIVRDLPAQFTLACSSANAVVVPNRFGN